MVNRILPLLLFLSGINAQIALPTFQGVHTSHAAASSLYDFTTQTFTNCGATGSNGPTLSDCTSNDNYSASWTDNTSFFNIQTQGIQEWTVPEDGSYKIEVWGAEGGDGTNTTYCYGGKGGYAYGNKTLSAGDILYISVGQLGISNNDNSCSGYAGGFNGGGDGGTSTAGCPSQYAGPGGGGASDVRSGGTALGNRIIVGSGGGGGGGGTGSQNMYGGNGGGSTGSDGRNYYGVGSSNGGGDGGSQSAGGAGGVDNHSTNYSGLAGSSGNGGDGDTGTYGGGGGGGGGYYGGGGGCSHHEGGGGGGSSYIGGVDDGSTSSGSREGHGKITITKL